MSQNISITVPYDYLAISSAAKMLSNMAEELKKSEVTPDKEEVTAREGLLKPEPEAKQVFATPVTRVPAPPAPAVEPEETPDDALDASGLPWDERIHAATKTKDVSGLWKYKRGVDRDVLVPAVEAELKAGVGELAPPAPVTPSATITTFAQLVTAITSNKIPEDKVKAALTAVGLQNFALLGARAGIIPTVAGHLGL